MERKMGNEPEPPRLKYPKTNRKTNPTNLDKIS